MGKTQAESGQTTRADGFARIWSALEEASQKNRDRRIVDLFSGDSKTLSRFHQWSATCDDLLLDWSKTNIDRKTRTLLFQLAECVGVKYRREQMFAGEFINNTDNRPALHTALRNVSGTPVMVNGEDVMPDVIATRDRLGDFAEQVRSGTIRGVTGKAFTDVVHIGIGGSQLGPEMACIALREFHDGPRVHFLVNVDGAHAADILGGIDPETTLAIVASKSFTTPETMTNAATVRDWLLPVTGGDGIGLHFVAISTADDQVAAFGIPPERTFGFADWVGGRLSMWGPIGLPVVLAIGSRDFDDFLAGGHAMDLHFQNAPPEQNLPMILALTGIWHTNFCGYSSRTIMPYEQRLNRFAAFAQQVDMESNGKSRSLGGSRVRIDTGPVVWGEPGTNAQHSVAQLLHQGTQIVPVEFMIGRRGGSSLGDVHHHMLVANCIAQAEALMVGRSFDETVRLMEKQGLSGAELRLQASHRVFEGNRPSITLVYDCLDPGTLGRLVALYEHRVFVEAAIWGINCFDQWGVELGKELARDLLPFVESGQIPEGRDSSTLGLLKTMHG